MSQLDGTYVCLSAVIGGKMLEAEVKSELRLTLEGDLYRTARGSQTLFEGRFLIDQSQSPWQIDITAIDGPFAGQSAAGIVRLEDNSLTICHTMPGQPRPSELASTGENAAQLVVWQRQ